jgi:RNA polymerase sigma-70 factor, ECF subfamily
MTASTDFISETGQFRTELLAYCYRMLGSADEAEDVVQETYLRAWRSYAGFEGRSSVRTWLYRIATNTCLTAIDRRGRRPLPSGLGAPGEDPAAPVMAGPEVPWLQPLPGVLLAAEAADPATITAARAGLRLALVAAWQYLSARQRAVLILRDVLDWPAAEVADLLGTSTTAVNSALRRARAQLAEVLPAEHPVDEPPEPAQRAMLDQFMAAFEHADVAGLARLLRDDVVLEMPPLLTWFAGRAGVAGFFATQVFPRTQFRMVATTANGQPATAGYHRDPSGGYQAHALTVLTMSAAGITRIDTFLDPSLFPKFGLPLSLDAACSRD